VGQPDIRKSKTLGSSYAHGDAAVVSSEYMVEISMSESLSANQQELYAYANHILAEHDTNISISIIIRKNALAYAHVAAAPLALKFLMFMLASQMRTRL